jgi:hypothetical protein
MFAKSGGHVLQSWSKTEAYSKKFQNPTAGVRVDCGRKSVDIHISEFVVHEPTVATWRLFPICANKDDKWVKVMSGLVGGRLAGGTRSDEYEANLLCGFTLW